MRRSSDLEYVGDELMLQQYIIEPEVRHHAASLGMKESVEISVSRAASA